MSHLIPDDVAETSSEELASDAEHQDAEEAQETQTSNEAVEATDQQVSAIPDKYQGKSLEEVIQMHQNAEKELGRQANEVGTYRELVATLSEVKRAQDVSQADTTEEETVEVTSDDLFDNPTEAIQKIIAKTLEKELAPVKEAQTVNTLQQEVAVLMDEHPDAEQIGAMPEFNEWVGRSQYRMQDAQRWIEKRDVNAARRLLTDFKEIHGTQSQEQSSSEAKSNDSVERARQVATESGRNSSGGNKGKQKTLSKREVARVFNTDRDRYDSPAFQKMLIAHARNGTLVD